MKIFRSFWLLTTLVTAQPTLAQVGQQMYAIDVACTPDAINAGCPNAWAGSDVKGEHLIRCLDRYINKGGTLTPACASAKASNSGNGQAKLSAQIDQNCAQDGQNLGCPQGAIVANGLLNCINNGLLQNPNYQFQSSTCQSLLAQNISDRQAAEAAPPPAAAPSCGGYPTCAAYCGTFGSNVNPVCGAENTCTCNLPFQGSKATTCTPSCQ